MTSDPNCQISVVDRARRSPYAGHRQVVHVGLLVILFIALLSGCGGARSLQVFAGRNTFDSPLAIALGTGGRVYVADAGGGDIVTLTANGRLIARWSGPTSGGHPFSRPTGLAVGTGGVLYVVDSGAAEVDKLSPTGRLLARWHGSNLLRAPMGVAVGPDGDVYVTDRGSARVVRFSPAGQVLARLGNRRLFRDPFGIALDRDQDIYVTAVAS